jgi:hypothetical protein
MYVGNSFKIITNPLLTEAIQTRFPKKKNSRRWQKKYRKKYYIIRPMEKLIINHHDRTIYCHPAVAERLQEELKG